MKVVHQSIWAIKWKKAVILCLLATVVIACDTTPSDRTLMVIDSPSPQAENRMMPKHIDHLDQLVCSDWMSEDELYCENTSASPKENLVVYDLRTRAGRTSIIPAGYTVVASPDRKRAFIQRDYEAGIFKRLPQHDDLVPIHVGSAGTSALSGQAQGAWANDQSYLLPTVQGELLLVSETGKLTDMPLPEMVGFIRKAIQKGSETYVLNDEDHLYRLSSSHADTLELIQDDVIDFSLAPVGDRLAISIADSPNESSLIILNTGTDKRHQAKVAMARRIQSLAWSPNGKVLAFSAFSLDRSMSGVFLIQEHSRIVTTLTTRVNLNSSNVWSPSGSKLLVSELEPSTWKGFTTIYEWND